MSQKGPKSMKCLNSTLCTLTLFVQLWGGRLGSWGGGGGGGFPGSPNSFVLIVIGKRFVSLVLLLFV